MSDDPRGAVVWDFERTLAARVRSDLDVAAEELARAGVTPGRLAIDDVAEAHARYVAASAGWRTIEEEIDGYLDLLRSLLAAAGDPAKASRDRIADRVRRGFDAYAPVPGIVGALRAVRRAGASQAVVSNWLPSLPSVLDALALGPYFDAVVVSALEGVRKPDVALLQRAVERLAVRPEAVVVVGDDPELDLAPAKALGCSAVHFDPLGQAPGAIRSTSTLRRRLGELLDPRSPRGR